MKLIDWLKSKYQNRMADRDNHDPWWVTLMLDVGRPLVAIMILVMCAPGEHYLMTEARFHDPFAWLGPATLTAYAGIAAVTATKRPKGSPGHATAVWGAVLSIALAMAAQPIAHLWGVLHLDLKHIILICVVSSVPSAVFGHLLHMGAVPKDKEPDTPDTPDTSTPQSDAVHKAFEESGGHGIPVSEFLAARADSPGLSLSEYAGQDRTGPYSWRSAVSEAGHTDSPPQWLADNRTEADRVGLSVSEILSAPDAAPDTATWTGQPDTDMDIHGLADNGQDRTEDLSVIVDTAPVQSVRRAATVHPIKRPSLSADVRDYLDKHPSATDADLAAAMFVKWPDKRWDSVRKARDRYQEKRKITT